MKRIRNFFKKKDNIIVVLFSMACIFGYVYFPTENIFQYKAVPILFLFILPFLFSYFFLNNKNILKDFAIGDYKKNLSYSLIGLLSGLIIMLLLFLFTDLKEHYFLSMKVKTDFFAFLKYELLGIALTIFLYEFFFRGFVMKNFVENFGYGSILAQAIFFLLALGIKLFSLPYWFFINYLIFVLISGWIYYKTRSLLYSFVSHWLFIFIIDATFIAVVVH